MQFWKIAHGMGSRSAAGCTISVEIMTNEKYSTGEMVRAQGVRQVRMRSSGASLERRADGALLIKPDEELKTYPKVLTDRLAHWASATPDRVCIAKRDARGEWRELTYRQVFESVLSIGQALLDRKLSIDRPVAILSENDLEHFLLTMAGQHVGIPTAPISPPYSLVSADFGKLRHTLNILTPGMVFVSDGARYGRAIETVLGGDVEVVATANAPAGRRATVFAELVATKPTLAVEVAHRGIDVDRRQNFFLRRARPRCRKGSSTRTG